MYKEQTFFAKLLRAYKQGRLVPRITTALNLFLHKLKYLIYDPASDSVSLHYPEYVAPDKNESAIVQRIFTSYKKMKEDQSRANRVYSPSTLWEKLLGKAYSNIISGALENDIGRFHFFLANFGSWKEYTGVESSDMIRDNMNSFLGRRYLRNELFYNQLKTWEWFYNNRKPAASLTYPAHGNQAGAYINGNFVGVGSFFNEIYGSTLSSLIRDLKRPVIAEIGAGYGKLAYFIVRDMKDFAFIDFDLPETLCLAAYYLMKTFPEKRCLLYGEAEYSGSSHEKYDMVFMPSYEICKIGSDTVDLFINKNSLGEMTKEAVYEYIKYISKATKGYFFHMNHDIRPNTYYDDSRGLLGYEYPVPADQFKLLFRYPDVGHMLYRGFLDFDADIFIYLYEKKALKHI